MKKDSLISIAAAHGVPVPNNVTSENLRQNITDHLCTGQCHSDTRSTESPEGCSDIESAGQNTASRSELEIFILSSVVSRIKGKPLRRLLRINQIAFDSTCSTSQLRRILRKHIHNLTKGKQSQRRTRFRKQEEKQREEHVRKIREQWPRSVPPSLKEKVLRTCISPWTPFSVDLLHLSGCSLPPLYVCCVKKKGAQ